MLIDRHGHLNRYGQNEAATPARLCNIDTSALAPAGQA